VREQSPLVLYVGDTSEYLANIAKQHDPSAYLISNNNIFVKHQGTAYTSIGDVSIAEFFNLLSSASKIIYMPPKVWNDKKTSSSPYSAAWITENYIRLVANLYNIPIENVPDQVTGVEALIPRKTPQRQLWVAGCSTTLGIGVDKDSRYQNILAHDLALAVTDLSQSGSSISWSRDQILKSDINKDDIVVWGITTKGRFLWFDGAKITHVGSRYYESDPEFNNVVPLSLLDTPNRLYEALSSIQQVGNFCNKIGAHLILVNIHGNLELLAECAKHKGFVMIHGKKGLDFDSSFLDFGSDNRHPGPKTHRYYAQQILEKIKTLNIGTQNEKTILHGPGKL
jgi:hypothetical protein